MNNIVAYSDVSKSGATYHTENQHGSNNRNAYSTEKLKWNWGTNLTINSKPDHKNDWFGVDTDSNTLYVGFNNGSDHGDIIRVFTADTTNQAPTARDDDGVVNENATLNVTDGANKNETGGSYDANGEHSGTLLIQPTQHLKIQIRMEIPYLFLQLDLVPLKDQEHREPWVLH